MHTFFLVAIRNASLPYLQEPDAVACEDRRGQAVKDGVEDEGQDEA